MQISIFQRTLTFDIIECMPICFFVHALASLHVSTVCMKHLSKTKKPFCVHVPRIYLKNPNRKHILSCFKKIALALKNSTFCSMSQFKFFYGFFFSKIFWIYHYLCQSLLYEEVEVILQN